MPKFELLIALVVVLLLGGVLLWAFWDRLPAVLEGLPAIFRELPGIAPKTVEQIKTKEGSAELVGQQARSIENIAKEFTGAYAKALTDNDEQSATEAKALLSEHGRNVVENDGSPIDGLRRLLRNLPAPLDMEVTTNRQQSQNFAELATRWVYPDATLTRYFYFTLENGEWKIDSVQEIQQ